MTAEPTAAIVHAVFETAAYLVGFAILRRQARLQGDFLSSSARWTLITCAVLGALFGSKGLHHLANPSAWPSYREDPFLLFGGKTIVGALLGGWGAVELAKWRLGIRERTGDLYVLPLISGMAIGRLGCFFAGLHDGTYGVPTALAWGVDFGDGVARHPTQLYEIVFLVGLGIVLLRPGVGPRRGDRFRGFVLAYLAFRLVVDFWKPYERSFGLNAIQWSSLLVLILCAGEWGRLLRTFFAPRGPRGERVGAGASEEGRGGEE